MSEKLKDMRVVLGVLLTLTLVGSGLGFYMQSRSHKNELMLKENEVISLQNELNRIGQMTTVYNVRADVHSGKKIEETDLQPIELPASIATNMISNPADIVGANYKVDITANSILTTDMIDEVEITDDMRYLDVVTHYNPLGIEPDTYVDIRISMPMGEDYIAMSHKKVEQINSGIMKLIVTEEDIMTYNSMLIDALLYPGTQIYAVEYVEGGVQESAKTYYPMSKQAVAIAQKNPNLMTAIREDIIARRDVLETSGQDVIIQDKDLQKTLDKGRQDVMKSFAGSQKAIDKERAEYEKQQAKLEDQRRKDEAKQQKQQQQQQQQTEATGN